MLGKSRIAGAHSPYTLHCAAPFPQKLPLPIWPPYLCKRLVNVYTFNKLHDRRIPIRRIMFGYGRRCCSAAFFSQQTCQNHYYIFCKFLVNANFDLIAKYIFGRSYYRSSLWYSVSSVCRL